MTSSQPEGRVGQAVRRAAGARRRRLGRLAALERRVRELEEEIRECRRHHHRTAELTDIVQALMVPLATRDEAELERVLRDYSEKLG